VISTLEHSYGSPDHGNKRDPLDELIYIILSQMTTAKSFGRVFDRLKRAVPDWSTLANGPIRKLKILIKDAGLSNQKAPRIKAIVRRVVRDFGRADLSPLGTMSDSDAQTYLTSLPGVGIKTAKCVLMYSLGRHVLPVDTHVARVSRRLGLVPNDARGPRIHEVLEDLIPHEYHYSFHVNAVAHGQRLCLATRPRCGLCPLAHVCPASQGRNLPG
jgi:endonuclease III